MLEKMELSRQNAVILSCYYKHGSRLSLQLMTNWSITCDYSNACLEQSYFFMETLYNYLLWYTIIHNLMMFAYIYIKYIYVYILE